ncbi:MAG: hypothetical protein O3A46_02225 [Candidatus Poribacteria bacterium]|nr:hypothetical protein [Candidatus Poribacteria bacterium]
MTKQKTLSALTSVVAVIALFVGCGAKESLIRIDQQATMDVRYPDKLGGATATTIVLDAKKSIRKIVVVPRRPLRDFQMQVRTAPTEWETVQTYKGRFDTPVTGRVDIIGDAVRVVELSPSIRTDSGPAVAGTGGSIETILVYGPTVPSAE